MTQRFKKGDRIKLVRPVDGNADKGCWYGPAAVGKVFKVAGYYPWGNVKVEGQDSGAYDSRFEKVQPTLEELYADFIERHPHIIDELHNLCNAAKAAGITRVGMPHLVEVLRWNAAIKGDKVPYKINNNYRALFSRTLVERDPSLRGFFEMRKRKGE